MSGPALVALLNEAFEAAKAELVADIEADIDRLIWGRCRECGRPTDRGHRHWCPRFLAPKKSEDSLVTGD